ncbi:hypothetical protein AZE42_13430 [Rhizopogon vesiculosus]|uniref:Uncharacterized protein n=1 Tax=Rhizopogon vesiculosus TaxID=180088 RepID=A0A1J8Q8H9_9AGAM|nr:hypothetical protein AZE42_13430 [Rhizopogon vesiculosus]
MATLRPIFQPGLNFSSSMAYLSIVTLDLQHTLKVLLIQQVTPEDTPLRASHSDKEKMAWL